MGRVTAVRSPRQLADQVQGAFDAYSSVALSDGRFEERVEARQSFAAALAELVERLEQAEEALLGVRMQPCGHDCDGHCRRMKGIAKTVALPGWDAAALEDLESADSEDGARGRAERAERAEEALRADRLQRLVVEHHALGAMDGLEWGGQCPVCKRRPDLAAALNLGSA